MLRWSRHSFLSHLFSHIRALWPDSDACWKEPPWAEREEAAKQFDGDVNELEDDRMFDMYDYIRYRLNVFTPKVDAVEDVTDKLNMLTERVDTVGEQMQCMREEQADLLTQQESLATQVGLAHEQLQEIQEKDDVYYKKLSMAMQEICALTDNCKGVQDVSISPEKVEQLLPRIISTAQFTSSRKRTGASHFQKQKGRGRARLRLRLQGPTAAVQAMRVIGTGSAILTRSKP